MHDFFFQTFLLSSWNQTTLPSTCCSWGAVHSLSNRVNGAKKKKKSSQQHHIIYRQFFFGFISPPDLLLYERAAHLVNRYPSLISSRSPGLSSGVKLCRPPCPRGRGLLLGKPEIHRSGPHRPSTPAVNSHPSWSAAAVLVLSLDPSSSTVERPRRDRCSGRNCDWYTILISSPDSVLSC